MDCVFCKIASGELPSAKIWENEEFMAILDGSPNVKGMTLVMPKNHHDSYVFDMQEDVAARFYLAAKNGARMLEKAFGISRVAMVMEGMGVNHAHIKLYPLHGVTEKFKECGPRTESGSTNTTVTFPRNSVRPCRSKSGWK